MHLKTAVILYLNNGSCLESRNYAAKLVSSSCYTTNCVVHSWASVKGPYVVYSYIVLLFECSSTCTSVSCPGQVGMVLKSYYTQIRALAINFKPKNEQHKINRGIATATD